MAELAAVFWLLHTISVDTYEACLCLSLYPTIHNNNYFANIFSAEAGTSRECSNAGGGSEQATAVTKSSQNGEHAGTGSVEPGCSGAVGLANSGDGDGGVADSVSAASVEAQLRDLQLGYGGPVFRPPGWTERDINAFPSVVRPEEGHTEQMVEAEHSGPGNSSSACIDLGSGYGQDSPRVEAESGASCSSSAAVDVNSGLGHASQQVGAGTLGAQNPAPGPTVPAQAAAAVVVPAAQPLDYEPRTPNLVNAPADFVVEIAPPDYRVATPRRGGVCRGPRRQL